LSWLWFGRKLTQRVENGRLRSCLFICACDKLSNLLILVNSWIKWCHRHWYSFYLQANSEIGCCHLEWIVDWVIWQRVKVELKLIWVLVCSLEFIEFQLNCDAWRLNRINAMLFGYLLWVHRSWTVDVIGLSHVM